ncbi:MULTISPECIES: hypothetical protein [Methylobacterium]|nr:MULTISPECIES: hypothetical protein [Methylobacterium]KQO51793.1 hypothetical protein ASF08_03435 [Methylobacterium sp. Leaf85]KQP03396.1 hypothetical protein ASF26_13965 [Methylobacterium sp. Leaf93]KQP53213.1 hypothetical protein ASF34_02315 [Methylobacterium sp. Leaf106]MBD8902630.1 hypothetical protein [Methylobacterium bullatum]TXN33973.1 hypothetical protein FV220_00565 [Methylobacterium sp. WL19]
MSKSARNDRVRYRATFLNTLGASLVMVGFFLPGMRLYEGYDHRLSRAEAWSVSLRFFQTEPGAVSVTALILGFCLHFIALHHLKKLQD